MASSAGRRNILRELNDQAGPSNATQLNITLPLTPTSPDEEIIKQRGRRKTVQYNLDESPVKIPGRTSPKRTPTKRNSTPTKLPSMPTRSSPRKRLNLYLDSPDFDEIAFEEMAITNRRVKRRKFHNLITDVGVDVEKGIMALSHAQLVELVNTAAKSSPEVKQVLESLVPTPDLLPLEKRLYFAQRNVFKAYPRNVWGSQDDAYCYLRVRTHIDTFKKECMDQCQNLMESEHWPSVLEYILIAWGYAKGLPDWSLPSHNKSKEFCIGQLVQHFKHAIRLANLDKSALTEVVTRIKDLQMPDELSDCQDIVEKMLEDE